MFKDLPLSAAFVAVPFTAAYMYANREFELTPDAVGVYVMLALLFTAVRWIVRKLRA